MGALQFEYQGDVFDGERAVDDEYFREINTDAHLLIPRNDESRSNLAIALHNYVSRNMSELRSQDDPERIIAYLAALSRAIKSTAGRSVIETDHVFGVFASLNLYLRISHFAPSVIAKFKVSSQVLQEVVGFCEKLSEPFIKQLVEDTNGDLSNSRCISALSYMLNERGYDVSILDNVGALRTFLAKLKSFREPSSDQPLSEVVVISGGSAVTASAADIALLHKGEEDSTLLSDYNPFEGNEADAEDTEGEAQEVVTSSSVVVAAAADGKHAQAAGSGRSTVASPSTSGSRMQYNSVKTQLFMSPDDWAKYKGEFGQPRNSRQFFLVAKPVPIAKKAQYEGDGHQSVVAQVPNLFAHSKMRPRKKRRIEGGAGPVAKSANGFS